MSVKDLRRPPFAWVALEALARIQRQLPASRQVGARNALLTLAQAASVRRDGEHEDGDTLAELAGLAGVGARRLREHLRDLETIGLASVEARRDDAGRDLPTIYTLCDPHGGTAKLAPRGTAPVAKVAADPSPPTRAGVTLELQEEEQEASPNPSASGGERPLAPVEPRGNRKRDRVRFEAERDAYHAQLQTWAPHVADLNGLAEPWERIDQALRASVGESGYVQWLAGLHPHRLTDGVLVLAAPADMHGYVTGRYGSLLERVVTAVLPGVTSVDVVPCTAAIREAA